MRKRSIPLAIAISFGLLTLLGLTFSLPELSNLLLGWAGFLVAVALILGILNLFVVHLGRLRHGNLYSGVLVLSMLAVFALAFTDSNGITTNGVETVFSWVQAPMEAALASLLAFFLVAAGFQLLRRDRSWSAALFLGTAVFILLSQALLALPLPGQQSTQILSQFRTLINNVIVTAGMRGILIGVALGTITLSLRLLVGMERPYSDE
ncbi:MAG: hypothetical protein D6706_17875 [Chloroflexi bacterium]|nr:MAG: hypothetical protein D6706_17875 [Chloroflexota bacterium]